MSAQNQAHRIDVRPIGAMGGGDWVAAYCSCGNYRSNRYASPKRALKAGMKHVNAKTKGGCASDGR